MTEKSNAIIVRNASDGYGYKYSSLADLAEAGVNIPRMRIKPTEFGEFVEYLDANGEWQTGARVVLFAAKGMNEAQAYGAALTYARRYTVQMAGSVACNDDDAVEKAKPVRQSSGSTQAVSRASQKQIDFLKNLLTKAGKPEDEIADTIKKAQVSNSAQVSMWIEKARVLAEGAGND